MILSHIVSAAQNGVIGTDNTLPWDIPEDLKYFKDKTKGKAIIMGRKTFESIGRPLPHRLNVVITRNKDYKAEGVQVVSTLNEAIELCKAQQDKYGEEIFIIGGGEIFKDSLDIVDRVYLTRIYRFYPGDVVYPDLDPDQWKEVERHDREDPVRFAFLTYERKK